MAIPQTARSSHSQPMFAKMGFLLTPWQDSMSGNVEDYMPEPIRHLLPLLTFYCFCISLFPFISGVPTRCCWISLR